MNAHAPLANTHSHVLDAMAFPLWGSRLIEASAGTGKTWTIAALYLRLVLGSVGDELERRPLLPSQILVMTFTRAATRELSDRIRARLIEAVQCFRGVAEPATHDHFLRDLRGLYPEGEARTKAAWLLDMAAQSMDDAAIHTIDAWCQRMLREHAFDSGSLFDETLEPDENQRRIEAAQDYWRQQCYPLPRQQLDWVASVWGGYANFESGVRALLKENWRANADPLQPLSQVLPELIGTREALAQQWQGKAQRYRDWLLGQMAEFPAHWNKARLKPEKVAEWFEALQAWTQQASDQQFWQSEAFATARQNLCAGHLQTCRVKTAPVIELPREAVDFEVLAETMESLPSLSAALRLHAAQHVQERLQWIKQQAGTFGFADMLQRLDKALSGEQGEALRASILAQYPVALIDEFQDTSPLQYRLFEQIYRTASNDRDSALLLIGDPKQSIYGFRGADIYNYLHARRATEGRHYVLGTNYRSTQGLVDAVNHWFMQAETRMEAGAGAFLFRESNGDNPLPFEPVAANGRREVLVQQGQPVPAVTVAWAQDGSEEPKPWNQDTIRKVFAEQCANQIVQWLMDRSAGFQQPDGSLQCMRPADIAVLVRSGREAQTVRDALARSGVASVYLSDRDSVFDSNEAQDLLWWLRAVAAPRDTTAVRAGLATRMMGLSFDELAWLASDEEAFDARSEQLQALHGVWQRQGVLAMLRQTLYRFDLPARWLAAIGGERSLTNYLHLAELLQSASAQLEGEQALIRWLAMQMQSAAETVDAQIVRLESDADLVKVVTVHKSKGLEYPVVCLPFAGAFRESKSDDAYLSLPVETEAGPSRQLLLEFDKEQLQAADRERLREDLRLFYVAVTRPRHALWMGLTPQSVGNSKTCQNEKGAAGYLLSGGLPADMNGWRERVLQLARDCAHIAVLDVGAEPIPAQQWQAPDAAVPLQPAPMYDARFDTRWGIGSFSALTRAMAPASLPVLPVSNHQPASDEVGQESAANTLELGAMEQALQTKTAADVAVWHRFMRGPVVGNFLHDQLEWLAGEGFDLPAEPQEENTLLETRLLRRCERAGRQGQALDVLRWMRAVVHHPLVPIGVSLQELAVHDTLLTEMEFWLPAASLSAPRIDALCRAFILPGQPRPTLPQRELHGMLMGFADLVFAHEGRYWVLDYKTNHLGSSAAAYGADALAHAMLEHRYDVQAALYMLALHRLLQSRLGDAYDPAEHLGGAMYFFLRGIDGEAQGMHVVPPNVELLQGLDVLLHTTATDEEAQP